MGLDWVNSCGENGEWDAWDWIGDTVLGEVWRREMRGSKVVRGERRCG